MIFAKYRISLKFRGNLNEVKSMVEEKQLKKIIIFGLCFFLSRPFGHMPSALKGLV
jgi:hypothetical protein